jgi:hypothetical protein
MHNMKFLVLALGSTALAAVPAQADGLLGGSAGNCLCQAVGGLLGGGQIANPPSRHTTGKGSIVGNVTGSVSKSRVQ